MTKKPWFRLLIVVLIFAAIAGVCRYGAKHGFADTSAPSHSILKLELNGVIMSGKKFLTTLKKYSEDKEIEAIIVSIDSPGGAVGPSQEINAALNKVRKDRGIPVICYSSGLMASGAYYSAVACDRIVVTNGALVGSIGVIMEFANLEKLYDWAHITRYSIKSGKFKDSGAEYRAMRDDEHELFQDMINEVFAQFKDAVSAGRPGLKKEILDGYADGRVFTGAKAVELGFADSLGSEDEAIKIAADMAKISGKPEVFEPPKHHRSLWDLIEDDEDGIGGLSHVRELTGLAKKVLRTEFMNRPMYLMPGASGDSI